MPQRATGRYERSTVGGEMVAAFVPLGLPPFDPPLVVDAALAERWRNLAHGLKLPAEKLPVADGTLTRGDWVRAAFSLSR